MKNSLGSKLLLFTVLLCSNLYAQNEKDTIPLLKIEQINDWQKPLNDAFHKYMSNANKKHSAKVQNNYPIIIQNGLGMILLHPNEGRKYYKMDDGNFNLFIRSSHVALTLYAMLNVSDFNINEEKTQLELKAYSNLIDTAIKNFSTDSKLTVDQSKRIRQLFKETKKYINKILRKGKTNKEEFQCLMKILNPLLEQNINDAALDQLNQFKQQMELWKTKYPNQKWEDLRVVILGTHQPRNRFCSKLFFQWLLKEPAIENRVVYAEFQFPFWEQLEKAEQLALKILTQVDFEKQVSKVFFNDETRLQEDVLGKATQRILKSWGVTIWPITN